MPHRGEVLSAEMGIPCAIEARRADNIGRRHLGCLFVDRRAVVLALSDLPPQAHDLIAIVLSLGRMAERIPCRESQIDAGKGVLVPTLKCGNCVV